MKGGLQISILLSGLIYLSIGCGQTNRKMPDIDEGLIYELRFDADLISEIRNYTDSSFTKTTGNVEAEYSFKDSVNYQRFKNKNIVGLSFTAKEDRAFSIVSELRKNFNQNGYFIYISETNFGHSLDEVTVLKTTDKFDLLRFEGTNGINHNIFIEDVINKLTAWDQQYSIDIFAVGFDFVQAYYSKLPEDLIQHTKELYEFCPDIVDQGTGTLDELKLVIARTQQLYLWWD